MLLTMKEMAFLEKVTTEDKKGKVFAKPDISEEEKERLRDIDERNVITYGEHLIENFNEIE